MSDAGKEKVDRFAPTVKHKFTRAGDALAMTSCRLVVLRCPTGWVTAGTLAFGIGLLWVLGNAMPALSVSGGVAPAFEVVTPKGLDFIDQNSPTPQKYLIETMGGGVALLDYNNDGLLDIFLVNGGKLKTR